MQRKDNMIIWGFFSIVFIGSYTALMQLSESVSNYAYLISAFISLSATFLFNRFLKKRQAKKNKISKLPKKSSSKKASEVSTSTNRNHTSKRKKKKQSN